MTEFARSPAARTSRALGLTAVLAAQLLTSAALADAPFVLTTFTHMEGSYAYPTLLAFNNHVNRLRAGMTIFEECGAKMTIESEKSFATACVTYNTNLLAEAVTRGHGVGTHCDFGMNEPAQSPASYALLFAANKAKVDALVGAANNRHCSGGQGESDWVLGAQIAGFAFRSEAVALGYLSMPMSERPEGWTNQYIRSTVFHDECPLELAARVHPIHMADALNWQDDPGASYVLIGGGLGRIDAFVEEAAGQTIGQNPAFTLEDENLFFAALDAALAARDPNRFAKVLVHFPIASLDTADEARIRSILTRVRDQYVLTGLVQWKTQGGAFDAFTQWESGPSADINGDGSVNGTDLGTLLGGWGPCGAQCNTDLNGDAVTNAADLGVLMAAWTG